MKNLRFYLVMMLLACTTMSFAQDDTTPWKGIRFGYDLTQTRYVGPGSWDDAPNYNGFNLGYVHAFSITKNIPLFIETGLGITFAHHKETVEKDYFNASVDTKTNVLGLRIPVNVVYKVQCNDKIAIKPFTGFYLRANLMAKSKSSSDNKTIQQYIEDNDEDKINLFDSEEKGGEDWKRVQFGWQIGATLDVNQFNVGLGYALDFNEISEDCKFGIFSVNLGYNF